MTGLLTQYLIAEMVFEQLRGTETYAFLNNPDTLKFAYLGATGVSFGDLLPPQICSADRPSIHRSVLAWGPLLTSLIGTEDQGGLVNDVKTVQSLVNTLELVVTNRNIFLAGNIDRVIKRLQKAVSDVHRRLHSLLTLSPETFSASSVALTDTPFSWIVNRRIPWNRTGRFLMELTHRAQAQRDPRFLAYALGARIAYAAQICGGVFISSIIYTSTFSHRLRQDWITDFIETWIYGFFATTEERRVVASRIAASRAELPTRSARLLKHWPDIRGVALEQQIELGGITAHAALKSISSIQSANPLTALPTDFVDYWLSAYNSVYGDLELNSRLTAHDVNHAYASLWFLLWFYTSGEVLPAFSAIEENEEGGDWTSSSTLAAENDYRRLTHRPEIIDRLEMTIDDLCAEVSTLAAILKASSRGKHAFDWDQAEHHMQWTRTVTRDLCNGVHHIISKIQLPYPAALI